MNVELQQLHYDCLPKWATVTLEIWDYDLISDGDGGYEVNDRRRRGLVHVRAWKRVSNQGTDNEFVTYEVSDGTLAHYLGGYDIDGDQNAYYVCNSKCCPTGEAYVKHISIRLFGKGIPYSKRPKAALNYDEMPTFVKPSVKASEPALAGG